MQSDVVVLGAGIVGVSIALNLQKRGRDVVLVDRGSAGSGASYGNAGLIEREAIIPVTFPQNPGSILKYALNRRRDARYHLSALPTLAPALYRFWRNGRPEAVTRTIRANIPLFEHCLSEHHALASAAGAEALLRATGWTKTFRSEQVRDEAMREHEVAAQYGVEGTLLDKRALAAMEPGLSDKVVGGLHYAASYSVANPLALTKAYEALFVSRGGRFVGGDARTIDRRKDGRWTVKTDSGLIDAAAAVVALGPWSDDVVRRLGYRLPFFVKRGYHMHYEAARGATLHHPTVDTEGGYMMSPTAP